jgi:hypothetical protein
MICLGTVKDGVVVLDKTTAFAEGTRVRVEADASSPQHPRGTAQSILSADLKWAGEPDELDRLLAEVHSMREEDVELQRRQGE